MILQHAWLLLLSPIAKNPSLDNFIFSLGTVLVAPVFLFLMGVNIISSNKSKPNQLFNRGLKLVFLGYALSALRFFVPIILGQYLGLIVNPENIIYKFQPIYYLLEVDILQVAGFSLMVIALLKWRQVKYDYYLVLAFVVSLAAPFLGQLTFTGFFQYLADPFFGIARYVVFPFFPWFFYPLVGIYFGNLLFKAEDKTDFYKSCFTKLIPIIIFGAFFILVDLSFSSFSYSHHGLGTSLLFVSIVICWLAFIHLNHQKLSVKVREVLTLWSKNLTLIYFIQWVLIAWLAILFQI